MLWVSRYRSRRRQRGNDSAEPGEGGVELNEMSDLQVQVMPRGDVAIATSFIENRTRGRDGKTSTSSAFETDVWQKIEGEWKIISLHHSRIPAEEQDEKDDS